jgi:L-threonylcarbamoyladenylate synthase
VSSGTVPRVVPDSDAARSEAVSILRSGGIVAVPTDTVYGIAADLALPGAIERLFAAKQRPPEKAVALLLADADQATALAEVGAAARVLGTRFWPGGLTLVLPARRDARLPPVLAAGAPTVGLRVPDHPAPRALAAVLGPLPTTSANLSGQADARDAAEIAERFGNALALVIDGGPIRGGPASTVVDCTGPRPSIRRVGAIPVSAIVRALDAAGIDHDLDPQDTPGVGGRSRGKIGRVHPSHPNRSPGGQP